MNYILHFIKRLHHFSGVALYINMFGMTVSSFLESIGILLLIPMLSLIGIVSLDMNNSYFSGLSDYMRELSPTLSLLIILCIYVTIVFIQNFIQQKVSIRNVEIQQHFSRHLRHETYQSILQSNWPFFLKKRSSDLINLLTIELARVLGAINLCLQLITSFIFTLIQIGIAFWLSPTLTLFVLGCGIILGLFSRKFIKEAKKLGNQTSQLSQSYLAGMTDQLNGMKDIKSNTLESSRLNWLKALTKGMMDEQVSYMRLRMNSQLVYKLASALLISCFILVSFKLFQTQSIQLLTITVIFARLWPRFTTIQSTLEQLYSMIPACRAIILLQNECGAAVEQLDLVNDKNTALRIKHGIECRNVSFRYNKDEDAYTLQNINLFIPSNQMTAIAGPSGAGKSTLIDLIMGLMQPESGQILVDGVPITNHNLVSFRKSISYVAQDPFLFNVSIRENFHMVKPDASDEQMWEALQFASSSDFVGKLPNGLDTVIGDRGTRLSGGERQRLVIARAIIRKPSILVLDEATSALDTENEKKIQEAIDRLKGTMTVIVVAHRLSTIKQADQVIVINQGILVEQGEFLQLAADSKSLFGNLLKNQSVASA
ncbi:ABC transporter ATP-binding protein [Paenibacillus sp. LHD-38]|uniref:ABC transporter ATP-binding protein n=1 Tax=Paenibacillus sp. LHD-38 TaxID=3072143 RepID=UPI00280FA3A9|nr:ABC transporter ATP-binding protein [Paenibacillus sp. LHD-38]MDQ8735958.1 ABC transporter ATP-binding protein [Paenibacillus sp. LHD-38]